MSSDSKPVTIDPETGMEVDINEVSEPEFIETLESEIKIENEGTEENYSKLEIEKNFRTKRIHCPECQIIMQQSSLKQHLKFQHNIIGEINYRALKRVDEINSLPIEQRETITLPNPNYKTEDDDDPDYVPESEVRGKSSEQRTCPVCQNTMSSKSLTRHLRDQHNKVYVYSQSPRVGINPKTLKKVLVDINEIESGGNETIDKSPDDHDYSGEGEGPNAGPSDGGQDDHSDEVQNQSTTQKPIVAGTDCKDGKLTVGIPLNFANLTKNAPNRTIYIKTNTGEIKQLKLVTGGLKKSVKVTPATASSGIKTIALPKSDSNKSPAFDINLVTPNEFNRFDCPIESCERNYERRQNLEVHMRKVHNIPAERETLTLPYNPNFKAQAMEEMKKSTEKEDLAEGRMSDILDEGEFIPVDSPNTVINALSKVSRTKANKESLLANMQLLDKDFTKVILIPNPQYKEGVVMPGGQKVPKFLAVKQKTNNASIVINSSKDKAIYPARKLVNDPLAESAVELNPEGPKVVWQPKGSRFPEKSPKRNNSTCAVATCASRENVHYFSFPHLDRDRAELWWEACNRSDRKLPDEPDKVRMLRICQLHFEDNCFHVQLQEKLMGIPQKRRLKRNLAMPTKNGVIIPKRKMAKMGLKEYKSIIAPSDYMKGQCAVFGCSSHENTLMYHGFPDLATDLRRRKIWIAACTRKDGFNPNKSYVCSKHFTEDCYVQEVTKTPNGTVKVETVLKKDAIPNQNLNTQVLTEIQSNVVKECVSIASKYMNNETSVSDSDSPKASSEQSSLSKTQQQRPFKSKCEVRNCRDYKGQYHFHRYPFNDEEMTKIWMEAVRPDLVTKTENSLIVDANYWKRIKNKRVCSRHFTKECYERDLMKELLVGTNFKTKPLKLKKGAIPTLDLDLPNFRPMQEVIKNKVELKPDNAQGAIRIGPDGKIIVVEKKIPVEPEEIPDVDDDPKPPSVEEDSEQEESFADADKTQTPTKNDLDMDVTTDGVTIPVKKPSTSVESMLRLLGSKEEGSSEIAHDDTNYEPMEQEESDVEDHLVTDNAGEITPTRKSKRLIETPEISQYAKKPKESHTKGCCVLYCTPSNRSKDVTYHRIPVGKRDDWWKLAGRKDQISADPRICSDHFTQDSFRSGTTIRQLMKNATPTLSLELPVHEKKSAVADMQIGLSSPSKKLPILTSGPIIYSTSTPIAGRNVSYIPMVKNDKSPSKVIVPSIRKKKMPQEDPKIFRSYVRLKRCDAAIALKKKLREKTDRFTNRKRKRVRDLDESDSDIEETSKDQPVLGETENEKLLNQGAQHIWNLEFENLKKKFEIMQAQLEAERAEKEKLAKQIETLKTAKTPTKDDPVVDADGSINFAFDEYFDSADQPLPKTEIKEEKSQEIADNDFNWDMVTVDEDTNMSGIEGLLHHNYNTTAAHKVQMNYKCNSCEKYFYDKQVLERHIRSIHGEGYEKSDNMSGIQSTDLPTSKFVDENTSKTVDSKLPDGPDALKKLHPTLGIEKIQCAFCEISFCSASTLKLHLKKMHPGVKWLGYACDKCDFTAEEFKDLKAHNKDEHGERFKCDFEGCDFEVEKQPKRLRGWYLKQLREHKNTHDTKTECEDCKINFLNNQEYRNHLKLDHPETLHEDEYTLCEICCKKIKNAYWQKHLEQKHPTTYEDESFVCYKCDILLLDQEEMDKHNAKVHANDLACLNCGILFETLEMLNEHLGDCLADPDEIIKEALEAITEEQVERAKERKVKNPSEYKHVNCGKCENCLKEPCGKCNICQKYSRDIVVKASKYNSSLTTKTCRNKICEEFLQMKRNDWKMKQTIKYKPQRDKELVHYQYKSYQCRRCVMISHDNEEKSYKWKSPHTLRLHMAEKHKLHRFLCIACNHAATTKAALDLHFIRMHKITTEQKSLCSHCGMSFMKKLFLTNHLMKVHNIDVYADGYRTYSNGTKRPVYQCTYCDKKFGSMLLMKDHTNSIHEKSIKYECDYEGCTSWFWRKKSMREHKRRIHKWKGGYAKVLCTFCDPPMEFSKYELRINHYVTVHNLTGFSVEELEKAKNVGVPNPKINNGRYGKHSKEEYDQLPRNVQCEHCDKRFVTKSAMQQHKQENHPSQERLDALKAICHQCNSEFQYAITLNSHLLKCIKEKPLRRWDCKDCDTSWYSHSALCKHYAEVHKKLATICHYCGIHLKSKWALPDHIKLVHEKIKDLKCDYCDEMFCTKNQRLDHARKMHPREVALNVYKCKYKGCKFVHHNEAFLNRHKMTVHEKPVLYQCGACNYSTARKDGLKQHIHAVHEKRKNYNCDFCNQGFFYRREKAKHLIVTHGVRKEALERFNAKTTDTKVLALSK